MSTTRASSALLSRIAEAALKEFGRDDLYVAQAPSGMALSDAHLELLQRLEQDRLDDPASVARLIEISRVVDCIQEHPGVVRTTSQDPSYLSDVFPRLINNVEFVTAPLGDDERRRYEQAKTILFEEPPFIKTPAYQEFCVLRSDLEKKDVVLSEMRQNLRGQNAPEERAALETELGDLEQLCDEQKEALEAIDRTYGFRAAETIVDAAERRIDDVPDSVRTALDTMELLQISDPIPPNDTHVCCSFFPSHLAEDNWASLKLTRADIEGSENDGDNATSDPDDLDDSEFDSIELEVQTLVCERSWLWSPLFENRRWDWHTSSDPISKGSEDRGERELIPAYIHALIFARNLTVKGQPSAQSRIQLEAEKKVQPMANLLMRAIKPIMAVPQLPVATTVKRAAMSNLSFRTNAIATRVSPLVSRSMVTPTVLRSGPVGPAVVRPLAGLLPTRSLVLKPGVIRKLAAQGRVVDQQGLGIYQATVTLDGQAGRRQAKTGIDGRFTFPTIDPGRYRVRVTKAGFTTVDGSITVPQTGLQTIGMRQDASCQVSVRLMVQVDGGQQPFVGTAKVLIKSSTGSRLESMDGRGQASFALPPGDFSIAIISSEAERISPPSALVKLGAGQLANQTLTFTIWPAPILRNPDVQLLGFVCRRVPRCPNPESGG